MYGAVSAKAERGGPGIAAGEAGPSRPTLRAAIEDAEQVGKRLDAVGSRFASLAEHAQNLASLVAGPYPTEPSGDAERGRSTDDARREPQSSVEAVTVAVGGLHPAVDRLEPAFAQIARALEMIQRAVG